MLAHQFCCQLQGIIELACIFATGLSRLSPATATATGDGGDSLHDVSGVEAPFHQVRSEHGDEVGTTVAVRSQHHQYAAQPLLDRIADLTQA